MALIGTVTPWAALADEGIARVPQEPEGTASVPGDPAQAGVANVGTPEVVYPDVVYYETPGGPAPGDYNGSGRINGGSIDWGLYKRIGSAPGIENGDTNVSAFWPMFLVPDDTILFMDTRAVITDNAKGGANVGLGYRHYSRSLNRVFGLWGSWDYDDGHQRSYQQGSVGFESLGRWLDFRINGYIPFGEVKNTLSDQVLLNPSFGGNNILLQRQRMIESAYRGFDTEIGGPLPLLGRYGVSGYVGAYYWSAKDDENTAGVRVRFDANVTEDWNMGVAVSDDRLFGTNVWMNVALTLPDGKASRWFRPRPVSERLFDRTERNYRVTTHTQTKIDDVAAINPADNQPFEIVFFDETADANGDGTFENPYKGFINSGDVTEDPTFVDYNALPAAERARFDVLFVRSGDYTIEKQISSIFGDTTAADTPIQLFDNQRLLSSAVQHQFVSTLGTFDLPGFVSGASRPILGFRDGVAGQSVVRSASNNEVRGFVIDGTTSTTSSDGVILNGIATTTGATVAGFNIRDNEFLHTRNAVVQINNSGTSDGIFTNNVLTGDGNSSVRGFDLTNTNGATLNLLVQNNTVTNFLGEDANLDGILGSGEDTGVANGVLDKGIGIAVRSDGLGSRIIGETVPVDPTLAASDDPTQPNPVTVFGGILNNDVSGNGTGLALMTTDNGFINTAVDDNTVNNSVSSDAALLVEADSGDIDFFSLAGNTVSGNAGDGVVISALNAGEIMIPQSEDLNNNGVLDSEDINLNGILDPSEDLNDDGILDDGEDTNGNGVLDLAEDVNQNGILDTEDSQLFGQLGYGVLDRGFTANTITNNGGTGLIVEANNGAITANIGSASATRPNFTVSMANTLPNSTVIGNSGTPDNVITGNSGGGIAMRVLPTEDTNLNGVLNTGEDTNKNGRLDLGGGTITGSIINNLLTNNTGDILTLSADSGSIGLGSITLDTIANNNLSGSGANGINILTTNNGSVTIRDTEDANLNGILDAGEDTNGNGILDNNGISNNDLRNSTQSGLAITADSGTVALGRVDRNNFDRTTAGVNGILINTTNANLSGSIIRNSFLADPVVNTNAASGINVTARGGVVDLDVGFDDPILPDAATYGNTFTNNVGSAIFMDLAGGDVFGSTVTPLSADVRINRNTITGTQLVAGTTVPNGDGLTIGFGGSMTTINSFEVGNNTIANSGRNGIAFRRRDRAVVNNVTIHDNVVNNSGEDALSITAVNTGNDVLNFTANDNEFTNSGLYGVDLSAQADAQLEVNLGDNTITGNGAGGIRSNVTIVNLTGDDPRIVGAWTGNTITDNNGHGLELLSGASVSLGDGTEAGRNVIQRNTGDGIFMAGIQNDIFADTNTISNNTGNGVHVEEFSFQQSFGTFRNNEITLNGGDGMEFLTSGLGSAVSFTMQNNRISNNVGRGVDILQRQNGFAAYDFDGNIIASNGEEGLYLVNTSSINQTQNVPSTTPLLADGPADNNFVFSPDILIRIVGNTISDNGQQVLNNNRGGLVMFIGTSAQGTVDAEITDNTFSGNYGDDVFIRSFVSTVDPPAITGTYPVRDAGFNSASEDPLARLDIVAWQRNTGDSIDVDFGGASYGNADQFKSADDQQTPPGPFTDAARRRNATRLRGGFTTARYQALGDGITTFPGGPFDGYEGTGLSTFRIENTADFSGFTDSTNDFVNVGLDVFQTGPSPDILFPQGRFPLFYNPTVDEGPFPFGWDGSSLAPSTVFGP